VDRVIEEVGMGRDAVHEDLGTGNDGGVGDARQARLRLVSLEDDALSGEALELGGVRDRRSVGRQVESLLTVQCT
jgi:hypothetical protein